MMSVAFPLQDDLMAATMPPKPVGKPAPRSMAESQWTAVETGTLLRAITIINEDPLWDFLFKEEPACLCEARAMEIEEKKRQFLALAHQWKEETSSLSSAAKMAMHPAYQQIIGMGADALPLIFEDLSKEPDHWFWALNAITRVNPVPDEHRGDIEQMTQAWLRWGKEHGYIK